MKRLIILVLTVAIMLTSFGVVALADASAINAAKTADELIAVLSSNAAYAKTPVNIDGVFYDKPVFARLTTRDYSSYAEFCEVYNQQAELERKSPKVLATQDAKPVSELTDGNIDIKISEENVSFVAVIYEDLRLFAVARQGIGVLSFKNIKLDNSKNYTFKLIEMKNGNADEEFESWMYESIASGSTVPEDAVIVSVSPDGNDANDGINQPVLTINRAKDVAVSLKAEKPVVIKLASGEYFITEPIVLDADDSGISFVGDENTVISGGKKVSGWSEYKDGIYSASVDVNSVRDFYVNGKAAQYAGTHYTDGEANGRIKAQSADREGVVVQNSTMPAGYLENAVGSQLVFDILWSRQIGLVKEVKSVSDTETKLIMADPWNAYMSGPGYCTPCNPDSYSTTRYYFHIKNSKALLDEAGEFYFDKSEKKIYYKPEAGVDLAGAECIIGVSEGLFNISGENDAIVSDVTVKNITFKHGTTFVEDKTSLFISQAERFDAAGDSYLKDKLVPAQITVKYANNITFDGIKMENIGTSGIRFWDMADGCKVINSEFYNIGGSAVTVGDPAYDKSNPVKAKRTTKNVVIENNTIDGIGTVFASAPGVMVYHAINTDIISNTIRNCTSTGISIGWGWGAEWSANENSGGHTLKKNYIEEVMTTLDDGAPVYVLGRFANGLLIEGNYLGTSYEGITSIPPHNPIAFRGGIYLDEGTTNTTIKSNVVEHGYQWLNARVGAYVENITVDGNYSDVAPIRTEIAGSNAYDTNVKVNNHTQDTTCAEALMIKEAAGAR